MLRHSAMAFHLADLPRLGAVAQRSTVAGIAPLFHITGIIAHVGVAFSSRSTLILHYRFEPSLVARHQSERRPAFTARSPPSTP